MLVIFAVLLVFFPSQYDHISVGSRKGYGKTTGGSRVMVLNATLNNVSYIMGINFIVRGDWRQRKTCRKSLTNFIT
jgi:hypothetical protein